MLRQVRLVTFFLCILEMTMMFSISSVDVMNLEVYSVNDASTSGGLIISKSRKTMHKGYGHVKWKS